MTRVWGLLCLCWALLGSTAAAQVPEPVLGLYAVPAEACSLVATVGFKIVHSYAFESGKFRDSQDFVAGAAPYLDAANSWGLKVLLGVPRNWLAERQEAALRGVVRELRDHPALLAWYEDEVAQNGDLGAVEFLARLVGEEDPDHGLVIEEAIRNDRLLSLPRARMFTYYPVTENSRRGWRLQTLSQRFPVERLRVPFWPVLQAFGRDLISGPAAHRLLSPTAAELGFSLNSALIAGATGIFFYPYMHPTIYDAEKAATGEWAYGNYRPLPEIAPELWSAVLECSGRARVLLELLHEASASPESVSASMPHDVEIGQWRTPRGTLLLLANPSTVQRTARLRMRTPILGVEELRGSAWVPGRGIEANELRVDIPGPGGVALLLQAAP